MNNLRLVAALVLCGGMLLGSNACSKAKRARTVEDWKAGTSTVALEEDQLNLRSTIVTFSESGRLAPYFADAFGAAIFPTVGKAGVGVGGAHGKGWVFRGTQIVGETYLNQVTVGFQLGAQTFSQMIFFETEEAFNNFTSGNFEFGAQASAVALTAGASAQASTAGGASAGAGSAQAKKNYTDGMAVFTVAKGGLMYEASLGGQKFSYRPLGEKTEEKK
jgi:lipid-binding SYLF domain-containing protein